MKTFRNSHIDKIPVRPAARDTAILVDGRAERDPASAIGGGASENEPILDGVFDLLLPSFTIPIPIGNR